MTAQPTPDRGPVPPVAGSVAHQVQVAMGDQAEWYRRGFAAGHAAALEGAETEWGNDYGLPRVVRADSQDTAVACTSDGAPMVCRTVLPWREAQP